MDQVPIREWFDCLAGNIMDSTTLDQCASILADNGIVLAGQVMEISPDMMNLLGIPNTLITAIKNYKHTPEDIVEDFELCKICRNPFALGQKDMLDCLHIVKR